MEEKQEPSIMQTMAKWASEANMLERLQDTLLMLTLIALKHDEISWSRGSEITGLSQLKLKYKVSELYPPVND